MLDQYPFGSWALVIVQYLFNIGLEGVDSADLTKFCGELNAITPSPLLACGGGGGVPRIGAGGGAAPPKPKENPPDGGAIEHGVSETPAGTISGGGGGAIEFDVPNGRGGAIEFDIPNEPKETPPDGGGGGGLQG